MYSAVLYLKIHSIKHKRFPFPFLQMMKEQHGLDPFCKSQLPGLGENSLLFSQKRMLILFVVRPSIALSNRKFLPGPGTEIPFAPMQLSANTGRIATSNIEKKEDRKED
jgi:hypothetical protein